MSGNSIKEVINLYKPKIKEAGRTPISENFSKLNKEMEKEIAKIMNSENEIAEYLKKGIQMGNWEDERYWALASIIHPSDMYLEYFFEIIETNDSCYPHWRILDVLVFMPEDLHPVIAKGIKKAIELNNPSWSDEDLKKAFEVLTWIGGEEDIEFIQQKCKSKIERIAKMAEYWMDWLDD